MNTLVVLPAVLLGRAVDTVLAFERGQASAADAGWAAAAFLGGTLATQLPRLGKRWWLMTANARLRADIRAAALHGVLAWPMERLHGHTIGELMARITGDVEILGVGIHDFTVETWDTLLFSVSVVTAMVFYDPSLTAASLLPVPLALVLMQAVRRLVQARTREAREANASLTSALQENLSAVRLLHLAGRREEAARRVEDFSQKASQANYQVIRLREGLQPVYSTLLTAGAVLAIVLGGQRVASGVMSVGAFVGFMDLFLRFTSRAYRIPRLFNTIQSGGVAYDRLRPLLNPGLELPTAASIHPGGANPLPRERHAAAGSMSQPNLHPAQVRSHPSGRPGSSASSPGPGSLSAQPGSAITGRPDPGTLPAQPGSTAAGPLSVSVNRAVFRYPGSTVPVLDGLSIACPAGSFIAITGPVGSGKSALLRLILGLYDPEEGEVRLEGQPFGPATRHTLAGRIGYLSQEPYLFSGDIAQNIAFGPSKAVSSQRLDQAVHTALLDHDLRSLAGGLAASVGEAGGHVSGGQRQRIGIARSLAATPNPPGLLLLDDPFSAVDLDTEARLVQSLRQVFGPSARPDQQATIILSSHRLAAFTQADSIYVLDHGHVAEAGTHAQLMSRGGMYSRLFRAQAPSAFPGLPDHIRFPGETRPEDAA